MKSMFGKYFYIKSECDSHNGEPLKISETEASINLSICLCQLYRKFHHMVVGFLSFEM